MASSTASAAATGCPVNRCINQAATYTSAVDALRADGGKEEDSPVSSGRGSPGGSSTGSLSSTSSSASSLADDLRIYNAGVRLPIFCPLLASWSCADSTGTVTDPRLYVANVARPPKGHRAKGSRASSRSCGGALSAYVPSILLGLLRR